MQLSTAIERIQAGLTPDLLSPHWQRLIHPADNPFKGHCYVASEALYHLWGKVHGFNPRVVCIEEGQNHWFLQQNKTGEIADPTVEQFNGKPVPYSRSRWCGFLTGDKPSKRCKKLLSRIT